MTNYRKKLIEVALPLDVINEASAREKSISYGHPSSVHLWWARRTLATARAVLFASLVNDPSSHPDDFPDEISQRKERERLFDIIEYLIKWENTQSRDVIKAAQTEISRYTDSQLPIVVDPFAGGGIIPLAAQWLGLEVQASDLNPVAILINKALIELPPKFSGLRPIGPTDEQHLHHQEWLGASGLAEDIRRYGRWIDGQAREMIGRSYPTVAVPLDKGGGKVKVIGWIWARTITCNNPACNSTIPLLKSFTLSQRRNREAYLDPIPDRSAGVVKFSIQQGLGRSKGGTVSRTGATCLICESILPLEEVRTRARIDGFGSQLLCTVGEGYRSRIYIDADDEQVSASRVSITRPILSSSLPQAALGFRVQRYGIITHDQLFTDRQIQTLVTLSDLVGKAHHKVMAHSHNKDYADAIITYLGLAVSRLANFGANLCTWNAGAGGVRQAFARHAMPMVWDYVEANPFSDSSGNFSAKSITLPRQFQEFLPKE